MKVHIPGQVYELSPSSFPFTITYISVVTGEPVEQFVVEYSNYVTIPNLSQHYGQVRTRIEWPNGSVQEEDPPGLHTLPTHNEKMLTFGSQEDAIQAFSRSYMRIFYRPFGCSTCGKWHVYLLQWLPWSSRQEVIAVDPTPDGSLKVAS